jgi:hypothetical protein
VTVFDYNYTGTGAYAGRRLDRADGPLAYIHFPHRHASRPHASARHASNAGAKHSAKRPG